MNLLKQIEAGLIAINQARFQDLINHLLHVQGYKFIGAPGSVVAKEKTSKGAPDSFFLDGNNYVFVECTTKERVSRSSTFIKKLTKDIEHCFDEKKAATEAEKINLVILACTAKVTPAECESLRKKVKLYNKNAELYLLDIQNLPMHIYDFPGLSEQYVGVTIVKGEIYNLPDFLEKTSKGLQPSLTNDFIGRAEEVKLALDHINSDDILLLSGPAGVGKSKLAVEILSEASQKGFIPIVIQSSAVPLWDDFVNLFQNGKDYLILFDDANKSVQNLSYLIDFIQKPKANRLKVIVTSRDYVKQHVEGKLKNSHYNEIVLGLMSDEQIEEIITKALPTLAHYRDIRKTITEIAKGNARVALMATYSVTPGSKINYLSNPVSLYEKYFEKIAEDIQAFSDPITLKTLAIVSFFGVINRDNAELQEILEKSFKIDWTQLWSTIMKLHSLEVLDVYANDTVKVSDQVLATYSLYKCFIDPDSSAISYSSWIEEFIKSHAGRVRTTLIDVNNTFTFTQIRALVLPHLQKVIENVKNDDELLYAFHSLFYFYKGYDTLEYLKAWVNTINHEVYEENLTFSYVHNDHTTATKYFDLLIKFWQHNNELLKPSIELTIDLVCRQPQRLPEFLKFLRDHFTFKHDDFSQSYQRQNILLDVLLGEERSERHTEIARGAYLSIIKQLLGWHFTEYGSSKAHKFTIYNFDLVISADLLSLRNKILEGFVVHFNFNNELSNKILRKIVFPGGDIDKNIYKEEKPIYDKLISEKLSTSDYAHCNFVRKLVQRLELPSDAISQIWNSYLNSDVIKLSQLLKTDLEDKDGLSWQERQELKRKEFLEFVRGKDWEEIKEFLYAASAFYLQLDKSDVWKVQSAVAEIFNGIAEKGISDICEALSLIFQRKLILPVNTHIIYYILNRKLMKGDDLYSLINSHNFENKIEWILNFFIALPEEQIDLKLVKMLIRLFNDSDELLPIHRMADFVKYDSAFVELKATNEIANAGSNIVAHLTSILLKKKDKHPIYLGYEFCQDCSKYLTNDIDLLKRAYIYLKKHDEHFDYDGKELQKVLEQDNNFFVEYLEQKAVDDDYLSFRLERFKLDILWALDDYMNIVEKSLDIIISKSPVHSNWNHPSNVLFSINHNNEGIDSKAKRFIENYIKKNHLKHQQMLMAMNIVLHQYPSQFVHFLQKLLLLNKDFGILKGMFFSSGGVYSGSRVPKIQAEIELCLEIVNMIKTLPDILSYTKHIKYFEERVGWLKDDIVQEQRRDFEESFE